MNHPRRITRILKCFGNRLADLITIIELSHKQGTRIRRDPATFKMSNEFFPVASYRKCYRRIVELAGKWVDGG